MEVAIIELAVFQEAITILREGNRIEHTKDFQAEFQFVSIISDARAVSVDLFFPPKEEGHFGQS